MTKRIGCLHAHYSNIEYIKKSLSTYNIELLHFVDPGLMYRVTHDENFQEKAAQTKVKEQIEWMASCQLDAILITCTNYIAILNEESISVPIIKIDEPYFEYICNIQEPQVIFFTNPATVKGTMERLTNYADMRRKSVDIEVSVINNTFELFMQGKKEEYDYEITKYIRQKMNHEKKVISVAQLSMVNASRQVESQTSKNIINPLDTLISTMVRQLGIETKQ